MVVLVGMGVALLFGLVAAVFLISRDDDGPTEAPPASQGGLVVETGRDDDIKLDERRPLRCFVGGQLVGELTVSDCARRNGVATGALDVGLDQSGALAAASAGSTAITPLPPDEASADAPAEEYAAGSDAPAMDQATRVAGCWRYGEAQWSRLPDDQTLAACLDTLYAGHCDKAAVPAYGRWGDRTLRLVEGRVEVSADNRNFHVLAPKAPACATPGRG